MPGFVRHAAYLRLGTLEDPLWPSGNDEKATESRLADAVQALADQLPAGGCSLYEWKHNNDRTIYKCRSDTCRYYLRRREALNEKERELTGTGMGSQFKVRWLRLLSLAA